MIIKTYITSNCKKHDNICIYIHMSMDIHKRNKHKHLKYRKSKTEQPLKLFSEASTCK